MTDTSDTAPVEQAAPAAATKPESEAQVLLDRFLANARLLSQIRQQLEQVRGDIDAPRLTGISAPQAPIEGEPTTKSFFVAMRIVADFNAKELLALGRQVEDLAQMFSVNLPQA